jgi:MFS family permease
LTTLRGVGDLGAFLRGLPRNFKVMMVRASVANFVVNMNPYNYIYVVAFGATGTELGILNSVGLALTAIFAALTGWIADRRDQKKVFLLGAAAGVMVPVIYAISPGWGWLSLAFLVSGVANGVLQPSWTAMWANAVSNRGRGTIYGLANVFTIAPLLFASLVGGAIVSASGGLTVEGIRPVYWAQAVLLIAVWIFIWRLLKPPKPSGIPGSLSLRQMVADYREVLSLKGARSWILMKSLGSVSIGMADPFWMLYASVVLHASVMMMAYMVTARSLAQVVLSPLSGRMTDAVGRKRMIIGGRMIMYVATTIFLFAGGGWTLIPAWVLMGVNDATGIAWSAEECELVQEHQRARMTAMSNVAFNALAVPASILGGFLWDRVSPVAPFVVMVFIDGGIRMPIVHRFVPESMEVPASSDEADAGLFTD